MLVAGRHLDVLWLREPSVPLINTVVFARRGNILALRVLSWTLALCDCRAAAVEGDAWRGGEAMDEWKADYLYGGTGAGARSSKGLRKRKASGRGSPVMANGSMMKGVLGEGPDVEY